MLQSCEQLHLIIWSRDCGAGARSVMIGVSCFAADLHPHSALFMHLSLETPIPPPRGDVGH